MKSVNWWPLCGTNFLGVFNDNLLKSLASYICVMWIAGGAYAADVLTAAAALLVVPYVLFSPFAGSLARSTKKVLIMQYTKLAEIPIMLFAGLGFVFESLPIVLSAIFLMGLQSALYSPAKYGLIRDIGGFERISLGTGALEMAAFFAILLGQFFASLVSDHLHNGYAITALMLVIALAGYQTSRKIRAEETVPEKRDSNFYRMLWLFPVYWIGFLVRSARWAKQIKGLNMVIIGVSSFWLLGSLLQLNIYLHCPATYGMSNTQTGIVMAFAAIGIGLGCYVAGLLSRGRVDTRLVFFGAGGLVLFLSLIRWGNLSPFWFTAMIFLAAFSSGFYKVPLSAWVQEKVKGRMLGDMIAYLNMVDFLAVFVSAGLFNIIVNRFGTLNIFALMPAITIIALLFMVVFIPGMGRPSNPKSA